MEIEDFPLRHLPIGGFGGGGKGAMPPPQDAKSRPIAHRLQYNLKF